MALGPPTRLALRPAGAGGDGRNTPLKKVSTIAMSHLRKEPVDAASRCCNLPHRGIGSGRSRSDAAIGTIHDARFSGMDFGKAAYARTCLLFGQNYALHRTGRPTRYPISVGRKNTLCRG